MVASAGSPGWGVVTYRFRGTRLILGRSKIVLSTHTKTAFQSLWSRPSMLNLAESASRTLSDTALALATDRTFGSMTLSERVQTLFEQLRVPVFRYVMRRTRDSERAEDITQETFLRLFRHLHEDRQLENARAWLFTVANHLAIDASRNQSRTKDLDETTWKEIEESRSGPQQDPEKLLLQRERLDRLHVAV